MRNLKVNPEKAVIVKFVMLFLASANMILSHEFEEVLNHRQDPG